MQHDKHSIMNSTLFVLLRTIIVPKTRLYKVYKYVIIIE